MSNSDFVNLNGNPNITDDTATVLKTYIDNMSTQFSKGKDSYVNKKEVPVNDNRINFINALLSKPFDDANKNFDRVVALDAIKKDLFNDDGFNFIINNINTVAYNSAGGANTLLNLIYNDINKEFSFDEAVQNPVNDDFNTVNKGVRELRPNIFDFGGQGTPKRCVYGQLYDCVVKPDANTPKSQCVLDVSGYVLYEFVHNYNKYSGNAKHNLKKLLEKNIMDLLDYKCETLEKKINSLFTFTLYDILCDGAFFICEHKNAYTCLPLDRILCHYNTDPSLMHLKKVGDENIITQDSKFTVKEFIQDIFGMDIKLINDEIKDLFISCLHKKLLYMFKNFNFNAGNSDLSIITPDIFAMFAFFIKLNHEIQSVNHINYCLDIEVYKSVDVKKKIIGDIPAIHDYNADTVFVKEIGDVDSVITRFNGMDKLPFYPFIDDAVDSDYTAQGISIKANGDADINKAFAEVISINKIKSGIYNGNYTFSKDNKLDAILKYDLLFYCLKLMDLLKSSKWFNKLDVANGTKGANGLQDLAYPFALISDLSNVAEAWKDKYNKNFLRFKISELLALIGGFIDATGATAEQKANIKVFIGYLFNSGKIYSIIAEHPDFDDNFKNAIINVANTERIEGINGVGDAVYGVGTVAAVCDAINGDAPTKVLILETYNFQNLYSSILKIKDFSKINFGNAVFMYYILSSVLCASFLSGEQGKSAISKYFALVIKNAYAQKYLLDNFISQNSGIQRYFKTTFNYDTKFFDFASLFRRQGIQNTNELYDYIFYNILSSYSTLQNTGKINLYRYDDDKTPVNIQSENVFRSLIDIINQSRTINHKIDLTAGYKYMLNDKDIMTYIFDLTTSNKAVPASFGKKDEKPREKAKFGNEDKDTLKKIFNSMINKGDFDDKTVEYYNKAFGIDASMPSDIKREKEAKINANPFKGLLYDDRDRFIGGEEIQRTIDYNISDDLYVLLILNKYGLLDQAKLKYFYLIQALISGKVLKLRISEASGFFGNADSLKLDYVVATDKINLFKKSRDSDVYNALKQLEKQVFYYFYGYNKAIYDKYKIVFDAQNLGIGRDILKTQEIGDYGDDYIKYANSRTKEILNIPTANNIPKAKYNSVSVMNQNNTGIYGLSSLDDTTFNFINSKPSYESQLGNLGVIPYLVSRNKKMIGGNPDLYGMTLSKIAQVRGKERKTIEQLYKDNKLNATQNSLIDEAEKITKLNDERIKIFTEILGLITKYIEKHKDDKEKTFKDNGITIENIASVLDDNQKGGSYNIDDLMKKLKRLEYNRQQSTNDFIDKLNNAKFD